MLFASSGQKKLNNLRGIALQHLFLFDTSVDKSKVMTPVGLMKQVSECRSTSHTLTGNVLAATPIGGIKEGKFYPAHTGRINQFSVVASNLGWYFTQSSVDGFTEADHADRFVTVSESPILGNYMNRASNMLGAFTGYEGKNSLDSQRRAYFLPNSRKALFNGSVLKHTPAPQSKWGRTDSAYQDTTTYNQGIESGFFASGEGYQDNFSRLSLSTTFNTTFNGSTVIDIASSLKNQGGILLLNPTYSWARQWFANATWYSTNGGSYNWLDSSAQKSVGLPYIVTTQADDPDATLSFGAVAVSHSLAREIIQLDIGVDKDLMPNTDTQIGTEPTFTCSTEVLSIININTNYDLTATKFITQ